MKTLVARLAALFCAFCFGIPTFVRADVVVNEVMTAGSERMLRWSAAGVPQFGFGAPWHAIAFDDSSWQEGIGPFGFGSFTNVSPAPTVGTNVATQMQNLTPTLYLRKTFTVTEEEAASTELLRLVSQFNDGFVCYINGVEVGRRNAGPPNQFNYHDQFAAYGTPANNEASTTPYLRSETVPLVAANTVLVPGTNVLAIHALNYWEATSVINTSTNAFAGVDNRNNFYFKADLRIGNDLPKVRNNSAWKYFPGVTEPSGGVYDPALLFSAKQSVPWGKTAFDDTNWAIGAAPFGAGTPPGSITLGTNVTSQVVGKTPSVYFRIVFNATAADLANTLGLQLLMDHDDSFVAYINGVEVARDRLGIPHAFTPHDSVADSARGPGSPATYNLDPPAKLLIEGQNVLAVQVHNLSINDLDLFFRCLLRTNSAGTNRILVNYTDMWRYFVGIDEPVQAIGEAEEDNPEAPDAQLDWVELHNNGTTAVSLAGWYLSDDPADRRKWRFPSGTSIAPGGYLLVICDSADITAPAAGGYLHTNFGLSADGETITLANSAGQNVQDLAIPSLTAFNSYGRNESGEYRYLETPTPRALNTTSTLQDIVAAPTFNLAGGFYSGTQSVTLQTSTPGASIRFTRDGTEPTETTGEVATAAVSVTTSTAIRARAFKAGMIPSGTTTRTYLINEPATRKGVAALCITGDEKRSLYRPFGIMAIAGGGHTNLAAPLPTGNNGIWSQTAPDSVSTADLSAYNNAFHRGRFLERPAMMEMLYPTGAPGFNTGFGMRISGSGHARPRYKLTNQNRDSNASPGQRPNDGPWSPTDFTQKPSFNFYFRGDFGGDLIFPLFPGSPVTQFHDLRCRAGKNDTSNPFVEDEFMRRLFINMGQAGSRGIINTLYVNGVYKGYYNLCEHLREEFFQQHYGSSLAWDVRQVTSIASGDGLAFQEMITFLRNNPQDVAANYQAMKTRLDMVNFIDYLIVNLFGNTGDWPHNNYVCSRERSATGLHRYHVWDAEGAFGDFSGTVRTNQFVNGTTGSIVLSSDAAARSAGLGEGIRVLYHLLRANPEFRLLFADRLQKHFFNGGALTENALFPNWNALKGEIQTLLGSTSVTDRVTPWVNGQGDPSRYTLSSGTTGSVVNNPSRRKVLFEGYVDDTAGGIIVPAQLVAEKLWPATLAPQFSKFGGTVSPGFSLTISNSPGVNGTGTIYYTTDGRDPRAEGGAVAGAAYSTAITIQFPTAVRARVRSAGGEWSPLVEAFFDTGVLPPLLITEIMYHPANNGSIDGDEYEFIELKNVGTQTINLHGFKFTAGITYTFPPGATIAPGTHKVIAKNATQFAVRYPNVPLLDSWGASTNLANSGETLTLSDAAGRTIFSLTWSDQAPWPVSADGDGPSLVPVNANSNPSPHDPTSWRASLASGGSPGADDPIPAVTPVYINELLANPSGSEADRVELHNPNISSVDVSHWWLSDTISTPKKYRIPAGTVIPGGSYVVLSESQFNTGATAFSFSSNGEEVILSSSDAAGNLTGFSHSLQFGPSDPGVSFGRYRNSRSAEFFVAQIAQTFGAANAGPRVGPLTLGELMVLPAAGGDEFIEVRNSSSQTVPLYDPTNPANTWKIDGVAFNFPAGVTLSPGQIVLVVPINPASFASKYNVPASISIYGPYTGSLNNAGERVTIQKPGPPYINNLGQTVVPYIDVDSVTYDDLAPWPDVDGNGRTLERVNSYAFGDDPLNWRATVVGGTLGKPVTLSLSSWLGQRFTPAQQTNPDVSGRLADPDRDGLPNLREWAHGLDPWIGDGTATVSTAIENYSDGQSYLTVRYRRNLGASGLSIFVDLSPDLAAWHLNAAVSVGNPVNNGDGTETITARDIVPVTNETSQRRFIRLRVIGQ